MATKDGSMVYASMHSMSKLIGPGWPEIFFDLIRLGIPKPKEITVPGTIQYHGGTSTVSLPSGLVHEFLIWLMLKSVFESHKLLCENEFKG